MLTGILGAPRRSICFSQRLTSGELTSGTWSMGGYPGMTATWALTVATTKSETARHLSSILEKDKVGMRMLDQGRRGASCGISRAIFI